MKYELINNLNYTEEEVEDMDPQVAAIVIEKGLSRPIKGMPDSWKRKYSRSYLSETSSLVNLSKLKEYLSTNASKITGSLLILTCISIYLSQNVEYLNFLFRNNNNKSSIYNIITKLGNNLEKSDIDLELFDLIERKKKNSLFGLNKLFTKFKYSMKR
jgi:hypothetical protein